MCDRAVRCGIHFLRLRRDGQVVAKTVQQPLHEKIAADERMPGEARAGLAKHRRDRHVLLHHRHVTGLAAPRPLVVAVEPFLIRYLLRQFADHPALLVQCLREERVARGAQFRGANLFAFHRLERRRRLHDRGVALVGLERTIDAAFARRRFLIDLEAPDEAFPPAEILLRDLMTDRAGDPIVRQPVA